MASQTDEFSSEQVQLLNQMLEIRTQLADIGQTTEQLTVCHHRLSSGMPLRGMFLLLFSLTTAEGRRWQGWPTTVDAQPIEVGA